MSLFLWLKHFFVSHCWVVDTDVKALLRDSAILPSPAAQGFHSSAFLAEESHRLAEVHVTTREAQVLPSPAVLFQPPSFAHTLVTQGKQWDRTLLLIFTQAKDFYSRLPTGKHLLLEQGNQPQFSLAVPDLAAKHRHKPPVQTTFPLSECTSLGQSKVPEELWGSRWTSWTCAGI